MDRDSEVLYYSTVGISYPNLISPQTGLQIVGGRSLHGAAGGGNGSDPLVSLALQRSIAPSVAVCTGVARPRHEVCIPPPSAHFQSSLTDVPAEENLWA